VTPQEWIIAVFIFAFGCCIGSFLNVVIYRLPREKSLVHPGSACPHCGKPIRFYDNIPLLSWLILRARCRNCKAPISPRYFVVELLTGCAFLGLYLAYFYTGVRPTMGTIQGTWFVYLLHLILIAAFIAASGIDLELWIIPLSICWFVTAVGFIGSAVAGWGDSPIIDPEVIKAYSLLPTASPRTGALALGATVGLGIGWLLLRTGVLKRSYEQDVAADKEAPIVDDKGRPAGPGPFEEPQYNHRLEALREVLFLLPIILGAILAWGMLGTSGRVGTWWKEVLTHPPIAGLLGSVFGYFVGCAAVWATRILGTLGFGKEAMGLGDVHLMGAAGTVVGPVMVVIAFFIAPFFGLGWALFQMLSKKIRQIPYGPFLSLAVLTVMIFHDWILDRVNLIMFGT